MSDSESDALRQHPFTVTRTGGAGLTARQVRSAAFRAPFRGVRVVADQPSDPTVRRKAAVMAAREGTVLCDVTAAAHWGLPLPPWLAEDANDASIRLAAPAGRQRPRHDGIAGRRLRLPSEHIVSAGSVLATIPSRTWLDCASLLPLTYLVAMGDHVLHAALATRADMQAIVSWGRGRRGVVAARRALDLLDAAAESPGESITRCLLMLEGIPRPQCNVNIFDEGVWIARVDMAWIRHKLIVEYDGLVHLQEAQRRRDAQRRNLLQRAGWLVITVTADDLRAPRALARLVSSALRSRPPTPSGQLSSAFSSESDDNWPLAQ